MGARRAPTAPLLGLAVLVLVLAVIAMHQLGSGHTPAGSAAGHHLTADADAAHLPAGMMSADLPAQAAPSTADASSTGIECGAGCWGQSGAGSGTGHDMTMLCLAILPVLLVLLGGRGPLVGGWAAAPAGTTACVPIRIGSTTTLATPAPVKLCVSRT